MSVAKVANRSVARQMRARRRMLYPSGLRGLLACLVLTGVLLAVVRYVAALPAARLDFAVNQLPLGVALESTHGLEHNAIGPYVWTKSTGTLILPIERPGRHRLTLALQGPPATGQRLVSVSSGGQQLGTVLPDATLRSYTFEWVLAPDEWRPGWNELRVEIETLPYLAPGDDRPLGILLARVALEPAGPVVDPVDLALAWLLLSGGLLLIGQLAGMPWSWRAGGLAVVIVVALGVAAWDRVAALRMVSQPLLHPWIAFNGIALAALLALAVGPFGRSTSVASPASGIGAAARRSADVKSASITVRRALDLLVVLVPLGWAAVIVVIVAQQAPLAWDSFALFLRVVPQKVESFQLAGAVFAYTLLGGCAMRAIKPSMTIPTLCAIFAVGLVALAVGAGTLGAVIWLALMVTAWYELGRWVLMLLRTLPGGLESTALSVAVGSGLFALYVLLIGSLGLLYPVVIAGTVLLLNASLVARQFFPVLPARSALRRLRLDEFGAGRARWIPTWFETILLGQIAGFALIGCIAGLGPEVMSDAYRVHLAIAQQFVVEHKVYGLPDQSFSLWPIPGQLLFTAGMALGGLPLAKLVHTAIGLAAIAAVGAGGARLGRSRTAGIVAAALFASLPVTLWEMGAGYVDLFVALYGAVALICVVRLLASRDWRWALLLGTVLGLGIAAKLTFGFLVIGTGLALFVGILGRLPFRSLLRLGLALGTGLLLTAGIWMARTTWLTGQVPGLSLVFGSFRARRGEVSETIGNLSTFGTGRSLAAFVRLPWDLTLSSMHFGENAEGFVGFAFLLLLPTLFVLPRQRRMLAALVFVATPLVLWFFTAQYIRYLLPTLALLAAVLGVAVVRLRQRLTRYRLAGRIAMHAHAAVFSMVLLASLGGYFLTFLFYPGALPVRVVLGREQPETYLANTLGIYEATQKLDQLVAPGTLVAAVPVGPQIYTRARLFTPMEDEPGLIWSESIPALLALLERYGITYIMIEERAVPEYWRDFWIVRPEFLENYTDRVFTSDGATIYRLRPAGGNRVDELLRDAGFEEGGGRTSPWLGLTDAPPFALAADPRDGRLALRIQGREGYYQTVDVQGGLGYRLQYTARSDLDFASAELRVDWYSSTGTLVQSSPSRIWLKREWGTYSLWQRAPADATVAVVYIVAWPHTLGWFEDYSFQQVD